MQTGGKKNVILAVMTEEEHKKMNRTHTSWHIYKAAYSRRAQNTSHTYCLYFIIALILPWKFPLMSAQLRSMNDKAAYDAKKVKREAENKRKKQHKLTAKLCE